MGGRGGRREEERRREGRDNGRRLKGVTVKGIRGGDGRKEMRGGDVGREAGGGLEGVGDDRMRWRKGRREGG